MDIQQALSWAAARLTESDSAAVDARVLLAHVLNRSATYLYTWPEHPLTADEQQRFEALVQQRADGQPVAYLTGEKPFWTLSLQVSPATLIPRADTEILVEQALAVMPAGPARVCDLGTGTGAVALALASERPDAMIMGLDCQADAVALARTNASRNGLERVQFVQSHWFDALSGERFDVLVSNPPYVEAASPYLQQGDVRFEPASALTAGDDGLDDIRHIIAQAPQHLRVGGWLLLEHGFAQGSAVQALLVEAGFSAVATHHDLAGLARVTAGQLTSEAGLTQD